MSKIKSPWRSMNSAPLDGTIVLVTETANGESFQVLPAAFMNFRGGNPAFGEKPIGTIGWCAIAPSRYTGEGGDCPLPVKWKPLSSTPVCWMPMPEPEHTNKLLKRLQQILGIKGRTREKAIQDSYKNT